MHGTLKWVRVTFSREGESSTVVAKYINDLTVERV